MNTIKLLFATTSIAIFTCSCGNHQQNGGISQNTPVKFSQVEITDDFWQPRIKALSETTVPFCLDQCCTKTGRVNNFAVAAGLVEGKWQGLFYDDSDLYKTIEGAAYSLQNEPNAILEAQIDSIVAIIAAAQRPDGYLDTYYLLEKPGEEWTDMDKHEMYCCGHLIEAAIAYKDATGKRKLLDVAEKFANHLLSIFGPGKRDWVPGHPEIELALVKLYRETGRKDYLDLAHFLLEERGHGKADWGKWTEYYVDAEPVAEMTRICGHAVRCMYLFTGMADWAAQSGSTEYIPALDRLWDNVVGANMYITGGIGSSRHNEGFTTDFDLPNEDAYCETCASVGMVMWNQRMNMLKGDGRYVDVLERAMYNGALAGISLSSDRFFYVNPLASAGNHHRKPWYGTACCPSQISRFLPSVGGYIYAVSTNEIWINLYIGSNTTVKVGGTSVAVKTKTEYPWDGDISISINPRWPKRFGVKLRIPQWCDNYEITVNGENVKASICDGYAVIERKWKKGDSISLALDMEPKMVAADPRVKADEGRRAIQRGPIVYCLEETDNPNISDAVLDAGAVLDTAFEPQLLSGIVTVTAHHKSGDLKFIPYYSWDNRDPGRMEVWVRFHKKPE